MFQHAARVDLEDDGFGDDGQVGGEAPAQLGQFQPVLITSPVENGHRGGAAQVSLVRQSPVDLELHTHLELTGERGDLPLPRTHAAAFQHDVIRSGRTPACGLVPGHLQLVHH